MKTPHYTRRHSAGSLRAAIDTAPGKSLLLVHVDGKFYEVRRVRRWLRAYDNTGAGDLGRSAVILEIGDVVPGTFAGQKRSSVTARRRERLAQLKKHRMPTNPEAFGL